MFRCLGIYISCRTHLIARDWTARVCLVSRPLCVELSLSPCHLELVKEGWTSSSLIRHPDLKKYFYFRAMVATQTFTIEFFMLDLDCLHTGRHRGPFDLEKHTREKKSGGPQQGAGRCEDAKNIIATFL